MLRLDATTRAEYDALGPVGERAAHVVVAIADPVTATVYDGSSAVRGSGTMTAPWAIAGGDKITYGELDSFLVTNGGVPDENWTIRFESDGRYLEGSFGLADGSADFRWSLPTFETGQIGAIGAVVVTARGLQPVQQDFSASWSVLRAVTADFTAQWAVQGGQIVTPAAITTVSLVAPFPGTYAYTFAQAFGKGEIAAGWYPTVENGQCNVLSRWEDGSVRVALVSVRKTLAAGANRVVISRVQTAPSGVPVTLASLQALNPNVVATLGADVVQLQSLLALTSNGTRGSPGLVDQRIAGPVMSEWRFYSPVGSDPHLAVFFDVRLYSGGECEVETTVENGWLEDATLTTKTYTFSLAVSGSTIWTKPVTHYQQTALAKSAWVVEQPNIVLKPDVEHLQATKLVPHYEGTPSESALNGLIPVTDDPFAQLLYPDAMGTTGADQSIGLHPRWDALCIMSGDDRAIQSVFAHAYAAGRYPLRLRDANTLKVPVISDYPTLSFMSSDSYKPTALPSSRKWAITHHPSVGYLAFLLSGRRYFQEQLQFAASLNYLAQNVANRQNEKGIFETRRSGTVRGTAWSWRTLVQAIAVDPNSAHGAAFKAQWAANMKYYADAYVHGTLYSGGWKNDLGLVLSFEAVGGAYFFEDSWSWTSGFMEAFFTQSVGYAWDIEPYALAAADHRTFRDWVYKHPVGLAGPPGATSFNYRRAAASRLPLLMVKPVDPDAPVWASSWRAMLDRYELVYGLSAIGSLPGTDLKDVGSDLETANSSLGSFRSGYWGNFMPAISYAVEHGAEGAAEAFARITGSSTYPIRSEQSVVDYGVWAIYPRTPTGLPSAGDAKLIAAAGDHQSARPASYSAASAWDRAIFGNFGAGLLNPYWSADGAYMVAGTGGHGHNKITGAVGFDWTSREWFYIPAVGMGPETGASESLGDTTDAPWYELLEGGDYEVAVGATIPATAHPYTSLAIVSPALGGSAKGDLIYVGRGAVTGSAKAANVAHRFNPITGIWSRASIDAIGYGSEASVVFDAQTGRYYTIALDQHMRGASIKYLDSADWIAKSLPAGVLPGSGFAQSKYHSCFIHGRLLVRHGEYNSAGALRAIDLDDATAGWFELSVTPHVFPSSYSNVWAYHAEQGVYYTITIDKNAGTQALYKLTPPANPVSGVWEVSEVTLGGDPVPDFYSVTVGGVQQYRHLMYLPTMKMLGWVTVNGVAILNPV